MVKRLKLFIKPILLFILLILPLCSIYFIKQNEDSWKTAKRWSKDGSAAQISVYISEKAKFSPADVLKFRDKMEEKLMENDALSAAGNKRVWADCYAAQGNVIVNSGETEIKFKAYGVSEDFFLFHPFKLISGSYFSTDNPAEDLVLLDEDCAWQLFGSTDIAGMEVLIDGTPHVVSGVIKREDGMFQKAAGNNKPTIYLSYESFVRHGNVSAITSYEVVMPNLTKDYAKKIVKDNIEVTSGRREIVETSERYSFTSLVGVLRDFGKRSMQKKMIVYPFWENAARGTEDVCALLFLLFLILLAVIMGCVIIKCIRYVWHNQEKLRQKKSLCTDWLKGKGSNIIRKLMHKTDEPETVEHHIDTIILDIGNVLVQFMPKEYLKDIGFNDEMADRVCEAVIENEIWNEYDKGILSYTDTLKKFIARTPELEPEIRIAFKNLNGIVKKFDYTDKWIQMLKESGYRVLYLSNISEKLFYDCSEELDFVNQMDGGILSFEAKMIKPDMEIYERIVKKFQLKPENCVFIDDRETNMRSAEKAGMNTIQFTSYEDTQRKLQDF